MKYNTIPFTNPDVEDFVGRFDGEDYLIKAGDVRYFPSNLSRHLGKQLMEKMLMSATNKDRTINKDRFKEEIIKRILGEEMLTFKPEAKKTFQQEASEHDADMKATFEEKERVKKAQEIEAMKLTE